MKKVRPLRGQTNFLWKTKSGLLRRMPRPNAQPGLDLIFGFRREALAVVSLLVPFLASGLIHPRSTTSRREGNASVDPNRWIGKPESIGDARRWLEREAARFGRRSASADLSAPDWPVPLATGKKYLFVDGDSLAEDRHRTPLLRLMKQHDDLIVVTDVPMAFGPSSQVMVLPGVFAPPTSPGDPVRSIDLAELRKILGPSGSAPRLIHAHGLILNVDRLPMNDPLVSAAREAWVVLLGSLRVFPSAIGWDRILKAVRAYVEAA